MNAKDALDQIDAALDTASEALEGSENPLSAIRPRAGQDSEAITICASTINRLTRTGSVYERQAKRILDRQGMDPRHYVGSLIGVLNALRFDIEAGFLQSFEEEVHADVFGDFLEMADQLLRDGYRVAAAVVAGSALEAQLRALAEQRGINTHARGRPKRAGLLNDELAKKDVCTKPEQKQVTAWQDLRNDAAHGGDDFTNSEIRLMVQGIRDFVARHPA